MAEGYEESMDLLTDALGRTFVMIREGYLALPIRIVLPHVVDLEDELTRVQESIIAGAARIEDLPAHPVGGKALYNASHHWLAGSVAYEQYKDTQSDAALAAAAWTLTEAAGLMELAIALLRQD